MSMEEPMLEYAKEKANENPALRNQIIDLYEMAMCEYEDGGSYENEFMHMRDSIEDLIEEEL